MDRTGLTLIVFTALLVPIAAALNFNDPNFAWAPSNATGFFYLKQPCSFNSFTTIGTGGIIDFNTFRWTPTGAEWPRFGLVCDTPGSNWNVTAMTKLSITVNATAGSMGRIWCPDQTGGVESVVGAFHAWDPVNTVLTVTSINGPFIVTWYAPATNPAYPSGRIFEGAELMITLLPLLLMLMVLKKPELSEVILVAALVAALLVISNLLFSMGF